MHPSFAPPVGAPGRLPPEPAARSVGFRSALRTKKDVRIPVAITPCSRGADSAAAATLR